MSINYVHTIYSHVLPKQYFFGLILSFSMLFVCTHTLADTERGLDAFENGNYTVAIKELTPEAEGGDHVAQYFLSMIYNFNGDLNASFRWCYHSAKGGFPDAQYSLASMYLVGEATSKNNIEALKWYTLAADQGHPDAQHYLARMYETGEVVRQDHRKALKWYTLAAERGRVETQIHLGSMYTLGKGGVLQDYIQAHMWFNLAVSNGADSKFRNMVAKKMTSSQLQEAQRLAREWLKEHGG